MRINRLGKDEQAMRFSSEFSAELSAMERDAPQHINGIKCDVSSCVYHDGESYCCADDVRIGPSYAAKTTETVCATYRKKHR